MEKRRTIKDNVEYLLEKYEETRGDDKLLMLAYWKFIDGVDFDNFGKTFMEKATVSESITRARRLIQEEGRLLPSAEIIEMRQEREAGMRKSVKQNRQVI